MEKVKLGEVAANPYLRKEIWKEKIQTSPFFCYTIWDICHKKLLVIIMCHGRFFLSYIAHFLLVFSDILFYNFPFLSLNGSAVRFFWIIFEVSRLCIELEIDGLSMMLTSSVCVCVCVRVHLRYLGDNLLFDLQELTPNQLQEGQCLLTHSYVSFIFI